MRYINIYCFNEVASLMLFVHRASKVLIAPPLHILDHVPLYVVLQGGIIPLLSFIPKLVISYVQAYHLQVDVTSDLIGNLLDNELLQNVLVLNISIRPSSDGFINEEVVLILFVVYPCACHFVVLPLLGELVELHQLKLNFVPVGLKLLIGGFRALTLLWDLNSFVGIRNRLLWRPRNILLDEYLIQRIPSLGCNLLSAMNPATCLVIL